MEGYLKLEDGSVFKGKLLSWSENQPDDGIACEIVFNTSMTGYLEVLTDSSVAGQGVVMTYPIVGSYGINPDDSQSYKPWAECLIVREISDCASNFRSQQTLIEYLDAHKLPCLYGIDVRSVVKILRDKGTMRGTINTSAHRYGNDIPAPEIAKKVACESTYVYPGKDIPNLKAYDVGLVNTGVRRSILDALAKRGCKVTVYSQNTPVQRILEQHHQGIVLPNGPENSDYTELLQTVKAMLQNRIPMLGIGVGHQLIARAVGGKTFKMKHGHRGSNYPVRDVKTGKIYISTENCGYAVSDNNLPANVQISFKNVNDGTIEGLTYLNTLTTAFYPDTEPVGKKTAIELNTSFVYDQFIRNMEAECNE